MPRENVLFSLLLLLFFSALAGLASAAVGRERLPSDVANRAAAALAAARAAPPSERCGAAPLVIVYGSPTPPQDLAAILESQPPLPRLPPIATAADVELHAVGAAACLRSLRRIRGVLLLLDLQEGALAASLPNLEAVGEALIVHGQGSTITSLAGLDKLTSVGHLALAELPRLATVQGLSSLRAVNGGFTLYRLPELQTLDAMGPIETVFERVWLQSTPKLLSLGLSAALPPPLPVQAAPPQNPPITKQQQQISGLTALRSIGLDLHLDDTDLPSLELPFLTTVNGEVALFNNRRLASTQGMRALTSASGVALFNNDLLADVDGFARLTELKGDLSLVRNPVIQSVNGFKRLVTVGLTVDVSSNPTLRSLDGFSGLSQVGQMLNLAFNPSLEALRGFGGLRSVGGDLIVRNNTQLRELGDLGAALEAVGASAAGGSLIIEDNPALASVAPLGAPPLRLVRGAVRVRKGNGLVGGGAVDVGVGAAGESSLAALEALAQPSFAFPAPAPSAPGALQVGPGAQAAMVPTRPTTPAAPAAGAVPAATTPTTTPTPMGGAVAAATPPAAVPSPVAAIPLQPAAPVDPSSARFLNNLVRG
jgi:hypothetical protein